jgi:hypothetical protein
MPLPPTVATEQGKNKVRTKRIGKGRQSILENPLIVGINNNRIPGKGGRRAFL